jgi:hypothetical protein
MQKHFLRDKFLNSCQDGKSASLCSGIMLESNDSLEKQMSHI